MIHLNMYKPKGHDDMDPRLLKEPVDVVAKPPSAVFEKSRLSSTVPVTANKRNIFPEFTKGRKKDHCLGTS